MTVILPKDYHARQALEQNQIECITEARATREDIRPLRIGILNIMPEAQGYEYNLLHPLGRSVLQIIPVWIRLQSHDYKSTDQDHLNQLYKTFDEALDEGPLDGMIITGAPVETMEFENVRYWDEIQSLLTRCRQEIPCTLGICWGAMAMAHTLGVRKVNYKEKLFGVYDTYNDNPNHPVTGGMDDVFLMPQSRHAGLSSLDMTRAEESGQIGVLASLPFEDFEAVIFETTDQRFLMNLGHLEYNAGRLVDEANRDKARSDVPEPHNFSSEHPVNRWRAQRNEFFSRWVKLCHSKTQTGEG